MKKFLTKITAGIVAAVMLIGAAPGVSFAEETRAISVYYHSGDTKIGGGEFTAVLAATETDGKYTLVDPFAASTVDPNALTQDNAQESAKAMAALYKEGGAKAVTDENGKGTINITRNGLYLVMQTGSTGTAEKYYATSPMLVEVYTSSTSIEPKTSTKPEPQKPSTPDSPKEEHYDSKKDNPPSTPSSGVGAISVYKVDADDNNVFLQGATFSLYKSDGTKVGSYTTDAKGYFGVSYLAYGSYYLVEDKAPDGYVGGADKIYFTLNSTTSYNVNYPWNIKVTNAKKEEPAVPALEAPNETPTPTQVIETVVNRATGDAGNIAFYGAILVIAAAGIAGIVIYKKKHKD